MSWEAAYHEAGHAVAAYLSLFHGVGIGAISLGAFGSGAADVRLSRKKVQAAGKAADATIERDPDVAVSLCTVLAAGFAAELVAASKGVDLEPNPSCSAPDRAWLVAQASAADIPADVAAYEMQAKVLLEREWPQVEKLARRLMQQGTIDGVDVEILLQATYGPRP